MHKSSLFIISYFQGIRRTDYHCFTHQLFPICRRNSHLAILTLKIWFGECVCERVFHCLSVHTTVFLPVWARLVVLFIFFQFSTALVKCLWQQINQDINNPRSGLLKGKWGNGQWAAAKKGFLVPRSAKLSYELLNKFDAWNLKFECEQIAREIKRERVGKGVRCRHLATCWGSARAPWVLAH